MEVPPQLRTDSQFMTAPTFSFSPMTKPGVQLQEYVNSNPDPPDNIPYEYSIQGLVNSPPEKSKVFTTMTAYVIMYEHKDSIHVLEAYDNPESATAAARNLFREQMLLKLNSAPQLFDYSVETDERGRFDFIAEGGNSFAITIRKTNLYSPSSSTIHFSPYLYGQYKALVLMHVLNDEPEAVPNVLAVSLKELTRADVKIYLVSWLGENNLTLYEPSNVVINAETKEVVGKVEPTGYLDYVVDVNDNISTFQVVEAPMLT